MSMRSAMVVGLPITILYLTLPLVMSTAVVLLFLRNHSLASFPLGRAVFLALAICVPIYAIIYVRRRAVITRLVASNTSIRR